MEIIFIVIAGVVIYVVSKAVFSKKRVSYTDSDGLKKSESLIPRKPNNILIVEKPKDIELSEEATEVLNLFENTIQNVFLTGKAGTGKSTLLRYFRATTKKNHAVIAPTGIAAINVQGQTIHSFLGFGIDITPSRVRYVSSDKLMVIRNLQTLIIDEISMVRADLLDCIDKSLRLNRRNGIPFGGVQIIAIGDPYQLPPIVKTSDQKYIDQVYGGPYFFHSKSFKLGKFQIRELSKIHRQKDEAFKQILNGIRDGSHTEKDIELLNALILNNKPTSDTVKLVTTNALARTINDMEMNTLMGIGKIYKAHVFGEFRDKDMPTDIDLLIKEGALVMLLNNDRERRWVNGNTAKVIAVDEATIKVKFDDNTFAVVEPYEWDNIRFIYNEEEGKIEPQIVGRFIQIPVKPAWAITIHKAQGQTHNKVHIDFGRGAFATGQAYVALSRCTTLEGLSLESPLMMHDILVDKHVQIFMNNAKPEHSGKIDTNSNHSEERSSRSVTSSDINKMYYFINEPKKYATGTEKAHSKVKDAIRTFESIKSNLDQATIEKFQNAIAIYQGLLSK